MLDGGDDLYMGDSQTSTPATAGRSILCSGAGVAVTADYGGVLPVLFLLCCGLCGNLPGGGWLGCNTYGRPCITHSRVLPACCSHTHKTTHVCLRHSSTSAGVVWHVCSCRMCAAATAVAAANNCMLCTAHVRSHAREGWYYMKKWWLVGVVVHAES